MRQRGGVAWDSVVIGGVSVARVSSQLLLGTGSVPGTITGDTRRVCVFPGGWSPFLKVLS